VQNGEGCIKKGFLRHSSFFCELISTQMLKTGRKLSRISLDNLAGLSYSGRKSRPCNSSVSKYPPAEPEALRLLAPQRGLIATEESKARAIAANFTVGREPYIRIEAYSRNCQTLDASPAEPGDLPSD
jgi:hypothetical protein